MAKPTRAYQPERPSIWVLGVIAADSLAIAAAFFIAYVLRFKSAILPLDEPTLYAIDFHARTPYLLIPVWLLIYATYGLYDWRRIQRISSELSRIINASTFGVLLILIVSFLGKNTALSRAWLAMAWLIVIVFVSIVRISMRWLSIIVKRRRGRMTRLAIVGANEEGTLIARQIQRFPNIGFEMAGFVDDYRQKGDAINDSYPVLGKTKSLSAIIKEHKIDSVVFISSAFNNHKVLEMLQDLEGLDVDLQMSAGLFEMVTDRLDLRDVGGIPMLGLRTVNLKEGNLLLKRAFDIIVSVLSLALASPVMLVSMILIKLDSPGPVFYVQQRVGKNNESFNIYKFRTMRMDAETTTGPVWAVKDDPRRTKIGMFLRRFSVDELPQLYNVLKGDMSLVGPRPERPLFVEDFDGRVPRYMERHRIKPGITGWAQVNGLRGNTSLEERVKFDNFYIENWSLMLDIEILFRTLFKIVDEENAY